MVLWFLGVANALYLHRIKPFLQTRLHFLSFPQFEMQSLKISMQLLSDFWPRPIVEILAQRDLQVFLLEVECPPSWRMQLFIQCIRSAEATPGPMFKTDICRGITKVRLKIVNNSGRRIMKNSFNKSCYKKSILSLICIVFKLSQLRVVCGIKLIAYGGSMCAIINLTTV